MRLILGFWVFAQLAWSADFTFPDFKQCYAKNQNSFVYFGDVRAIAVDKHTAVAYSKTTPTVPYIKYDPFLNLYLFKSEKALTPVRLKSTYSLKVGEWIAGMDEDALFVGNLAKNGDVLNTMYLQNATLQPNSIISCLCCEVYGLGVGKGEFIGSEYIKRFIDSKEVAYGDIGVRFEKRANQYFVAEVDPFYENQKLQVGDEILSLDGKKIYSLKGLNQAILFAKLGSKISLHVKRGKESLKLSLVVAKREGGGAKADSFLEKKGIFFDKALAIQKVEMDSFGAVSGLKVGDKLLEVNQKPILNATELRKLMSENRGKKVQLLFDRNNFQFFVNMTL